MSAPLQLLLVDDDPVDRRAITRAFKQTTLDLQITEADTLSAAQTALNSSNFDCVLLDVTLPGGSGLELLPMAQQAPVIFLTGTDDSDLAERALKQGAQDYLLKDEIRPRALGRAVLFAIERKRAEQMLSNLQQTERLSALGHMAASVAHEINNPSAIAQVNLYALKETLESQQNLVPQSLNQELTELVDEALHGIQRVTNIVRKLNVFSQIDPGQRAPLVVNELVEQARDIVHNKLQYRAHLELVLCESPLQVYGNASDLLQVLTSLLLNSAQAFQNDHPDENLIRVETAAHKKKVHILITDTGIGIPNEIRNRVLEPFFTTKPVGSGTGLGLSISKQLIESHGGSLSLSPKKPVGTEALIVLPALDSVAQPDAPQAKEAPPKTQRVLLIDDEPKLLRAYKRLLRPHETVCGDGKFALELLPQDSNFDLVLCDLMMPQVDGPQIYQAIERFAPHLLDRLHFYSGGLFTERMERFVAGLNTPLLEKPIPKQKLLNLLLENQSAK